MNIINGFLYPSSEFQEIQAISNQLIGKLKDATNRWNDNMVQTQNVDRREALILPFGSFACGTMLFDEDTDVDLICFAPSYSSTQDFFGNFTNFIEETGIHVVRVCYVHALLIISDWKKPGSLSYNFSTIT